jgi:hypothetical protein
MTIYFCSNGRRFHAAKIFVALSVAVSAHLAHGQPARLGPSQLDQVVSRIALYPDPLLAQVLAASSYWDQIPEAATWAQQHSYLTGETLAQAIRQDNLNWDPSVIALLPFPSVLQMMAQDPAWTQQLGQAVLTQRAEVMDAVQRMRKKAKEFGYLQSNNYMTVNEDQGYIEILPEAPGVIYVPTYDPLVVFAHPAHGLLSAEPFSSAPALQLGAGLLPGDGPAPGCFGPATPS